MKWFLISLVLLTSVMFSLMMTQRYSLPQITLPKFAQHNTIGELPIVEMADDGVFAEVDGKEAEIASYWCDELNRGFTCQLKFGMSYDVARRIGSGELFNSCEEAKKAASETFDYCYENIEDPSFYIENYNFSQEEAKKFYYDRVDFCYEQSIYIPECH